MLQELSRIAGADRVKTEEPMSRHTSFRIGGPAQFFVEPDVDAVEAVIACCKRRQVPWTVIGNGSNLLVSDAGISGVVIALGRRAAAIGIGAEADPRTVITAEAGALLSVLANRACEAGLTGLEFAAGIPGSVGGAVVMNAGAYGGEIADVILEAQVLTAAGKVQVWSREKLELSYRHSSVMDTGAVVLRAVFSLEPGDPEKIRERMEELRRSRLDKQPLEYPSAGSTFKRPEGYFAGKLIMDAGLRGYRVGDAQVAEKHCGFVINRGNATARQVCDLMRDVTERVREAFGVTLEPEVRLLGDFSDEKPRGFSGGPDDGAQKG